MVNYVDHHDLFVAPHGRAGYRRDIDNRDAAVHDHPEGIGCPGRLPGEVRDHREEYLGSERLLYGEIGDTKTVARFPATQMVEAAPGQTYEFGVARQHIKRFDPATGLRIRDAS